MLSREIAGGRGMRDWSESNQIRETGSKPSRGRERTQSGRQERERKKKKTQTDTGASKRDTKHDITSTRQEITAGRSASKHTQTIWHKTALIPSAEMTYPRNVTDLEWNSHFSAFTKS